MDNREINNQTPQEIKKKKKWIVPVIIGVAAALLIGLIVGGFIYVKSVALPKKELKKQLDLGDKYLSDMDYDNAILAYREAISINPKNEKAYLGLGKTYEAMADEALDEGDVEKALDCLSDGIKALKNGYGNTGSEEIKEELDLEVKSNMITYILPEREKRSDNANNSKTIPLIRRQISMDVRNILQEEQPVNLSRIRSCISYMYNISGAAEKLNGIIKTELGKGYIDPSSLSENPTYWENESAAKGYDKFRSCKEREIDDIPIVEVKNAIKQALQEQLSISTVDLLRQIIILMGRQRRTPKSDELISRAISQLEQEGFLQIQGENVVYKE